MVVVGYNDWVGTTLVAFNATGTVSFTLAEDAEPVYSAGKVNVMFNFGLRGTPEYHFYIPVAPEGITYKNILLAGGSNNVDPEKIATDSEGNQYYVITKSPKLRECDANYGCQVVFEYEGQQFTYSSAFVSVPKYVMYVLQAEEYANMPKLHTALADLVRAIKASKEYVAATNPASARPITSELIAACNMAAPYMSEMATVDTANTMNLGDAAQYISTIKFIEDSGGMGGVAIQVTLNTAYRGSKVGQETHVAYVTPGYIDAEGNVVRVSTPYGQKGAGRVMYRSGRYTQAVQLRTYALADVIVIDIYEKGEGNFTAPSQSDITIKEGVEPVATATFTFGQFINSNSTVSEVEMNFYKAFDALAKSSKAYMEWSYKAEA